MNLELERATEVVALLRGADLPADPGATQRLAAPCLYGDANGPKIPLHSMRQWRIVLHALYRDSGVHRGCYLLTLYARTKQDDLTPGQIRILSRLVQEESS
jgi:glycine/D-amino acid oxidase-like deaminating enzyme